MPTINLETVEKLDFMSNEAYKILRTNIELSGKDFKVISVTSCTPGEGKTSISVNLAISMASADKKVLLIDADLRKSVLIGRLKTGKVLKGFTHYLSGQNDFNEVICETSNPNLQVVFAGPVPPNPSELLQKKYFKTLLHEQKAEYDYIIIDTPPLGSVIDSAIIAKECDGVLLILAADKISYKFAKIVKKQLEKTGCPILGVVLNKVNISRRQYYKRYYKKYERKNRQSYVWDEKEIINSDY